MTTLAVGWFRRVVKKGHVKQRQQLRSVATALCLISAFPVYAQTDLPNKVQADLLTQKIVTAVKGNDLKSALIAIGEYKKLEAEFPVPLLLVEAQAAHAVGSAAAAFRAITEYLKRADRQSQQYSQALALYPILKKAAEEPAGVNMSTVPDDELARLIFKDSSKPGLSWIERGDNVERHYSIQINQCVVSKTYKKFERGCQFWERDDLYDFRGGTRKVSIDIGEEWSQIRVEFSNHPTWRMQHMSHQCFGGNAEPTSTGVSAHGTYASNSMRYDQSIRRKLAADELSRRCKSV